MRCLLATALTIWIATPAAAQVRVVPDQPANADTAAEGVEVFVFNEGDRAMPADAPDDLTVTAADGTKILLVRQSDASPSIAPGGFAKLIYRPVAAPSQEIPRTALASARKTAEPAPKRETTVLASTGTSSAFVDRFAPHEPIYGVFGAGDTEAKLQFSFAFRPFENAGLLDGVRFAYTQTMFWAINEPSGPFRATTYSPEVYYEHDLSDDLSIAGGYRHDSNGRGGIRSVDSNRIFLRAAKRFDLGGDWHAEIAPEAWFYVGDLSHRENLDRYTGYTALRAAVTQDDGLKVSLYGRGNPGTGKGAAEALVSYPLARIGGGFGIYLFGQAFTGYGEAIDDYDRSDSHARLGIALTR